MDKTIGYHYSDADVPDGHVFESLSDSIDRIHAANRPAELAIRAAREDGAKRGAVVFAWRDRAWADFAYKYSKKKFLYDVVIDEADIVHIADLTHYNSVRDNLAKGESADEAIEAYWTNAPTPERERPRIEILTQKFKVVSRIAPARLVPPTKP
ncbi:hypothetical protein [Mesorhizobium salmacidum]|uniref:Uncharacterized protein n=1 Tax=Mesorhizobium salmacidum TaxID=3015171 RepID=A0ABU8L4Y4_9HYPH